MKKVRNIFAAITLMVIISAGANVTKAGLLISDLTGDSPQPCTETVNTGILINSITGILINSLTGILINSATSSETENCGILINS